MGVFCWGGLAQSANNTTTIAEYIAARIMEHNISPQAHGLNEYALYNHRNDEVIDHRDYSISSEKITTEKIIGKQFATDENVGAAQDGIEFDRNAISMWNEGIKKVYIPKTGDPEFQGIVNCKTLRYLNQYAETFFETALQWEVNRGSMSTKTWPVMGQARFEAWGATADRCNAYIANGWLIAQCNPEFAVRTLNTPLENRATYFTAGQIHQGVFNNQSAAFGFMFHRNFCYGIIRRYNNTYTLSIQRLNENASYLFRAKYKIDSDCVYFEVNNEDKGYLKLFQNGALFNYLYQVYGIDDNGAEENLQFNHLIIQQDR